MTTANPPTRCNQRDEAVRPHSQTHSHASPSATSKLPRDNPGIQALKHHSYDLMHTARRGRARHRLRSSHRHHRTCRPRRPARPRPPNRPRPHHDHHRAQRSQNRQCFRTDHPPVGQQPRRPPHHRDNRLIWRWMPDGHWRATASNGCYPPTGRPGRRNGNSTPSSPPTRCGWRRVTCRGCEPSTLY